MVETKPEGAVRVNRGPAAAPTGGSPEQLALEAQRGSLTAFTGLVAIFEGRLFNFLLRRVGSRADAEDLTQESFVRAWEQIARYDSRWRFSTWLFTIASRLVISNHRRRRVTVRLHEQDDSLTTTTGPTTGGDGEGDRLWKLAGEVLGDDQHTALWLRYVEDLSVGEIARVLGKTQVGVRVTLFRARQRLLEHLDGSLSGESAEGSGPSAGIAGESVSHRLVAGVDARATRGAIGAVP